MTDQTIIRVYRVGRLANSIAQMMFVRTLQNLCRRPIVAEQIEFANVNEYRDQSDIKDGYISIGTSITRANVIGAMIDYIKPRSIDLDGVILRSGNFVGDYLDLFPLEHGEGTEFGPDKLVIHIRLGDVGVPTHPSYGPLPIAYHQYLVDKTGLQPVFIGEIDNSAYSSTLRRTFPDAQFLAGQSALHDFQTLRRAKHIAIAISSFSWIASYLSKAESIHVPVAGLLDPRVRPDIDLLPVENSRYSFHSVSNASWDNRYIDHMAMPKDFVEMTKQHVVNLRRQAVFQTAFRSSKFHLGVAARMALQRRH